MGLELDQLLGSDLKYRSRFSLRSDLDTVFSYQNLDYGDINPEPDYINDRLISIGYTS